MNNETSEFKESKTIKIRYPIFCFIMAVLLWCSVTSFVYNMVAYRNIKWLTDFNTYYLFEPSYETNQIMAQRYQNKNSGEFSYGRAYSEYLGNLQKTYNAEILSYNQVVVYEDDNKKVLTYARNDYLQSDYIIPQQIMKNGRCYQGDGNELILLEGSGVDVGDDIFLQNSSGKQIRFTVVGQTKDSSYMQNIASDMFGIENIVTKSKSKNKLVFLMNPLSDYNDVEHYMPSACAVLIRSDNALIFNELRNKGNISLIESYSIKNRRELTMTFLLSLVVLIVYIVATFVTYVNVWRKIGVFSIVSGIFMGYIISSLIIETPTYNFIRILSCVLMILLPYIAVYVFYSSAKKTRLNESQVLGEEIE